MVRFGSVRLSKAGGARLGVVGFDAALSGSVRQVWHGKAWWGIVRFGTVE